MNIKFTNWCKFDYYARKSYENFVFQQTHIKTEGLYQSGNKFFIICPEIDDQSLAMDGSNIQEWFKDNKILGSDVKIIKEKPADAKRVPERTIDEIVDFKGSPRNHRDVITDLIMFLPSSFPKFAFKETKHGEATILVERSLINGEINTLSEALYKIELPWEFTIEVDPEGANMPLEFRYKHGDGDIDLMPGRLFGNKASYKLRKLLEEDDDFWRSERLNVFTGKIKNCSEILSKGWQDIEASCMIDASVFPQIDIRNYLSIYKTLIIAPPLEGRENEFFTTFGLKLEELIELVMLGRIYFILPQSIDRYPLGILEPLIEDASDKFIFSRRLASLVVLDTKKRFPFLYPDIGVEERISILSNLEAVIKNLDNEDAAKILRPVINELSNSWFDGEELIHRRGATATPALGIAPFMSSILKSKFGLDRYLEFYSAALNVEWAAPFNAAVSTLTPLKGYSGDSYLQLIANAYSGINIGQFPIYVKQTSEVVNGLLSISSDIPVVDFARSFRSGDIERLHKLINEFSCGRNNQTYDTEAVINKFNLEIKRYESKIERLSEWNISGFVQGAAGVAGVIAGSENPKLGVCLAGIPLAFWLFGVLEAKSPNNKLLGEALDKIKAAASSTDPGVVLVSRLRKKNKAN